MFSAGEKSSALGSSEKRERPKWQWNHPEGKRKRRLHLATEIGNNLKASGRTLIYRIVYQFRQFYL